MAISVTNRSSGGNKTAESATTVYTVASSVIPVGSKVVVCLASDNAGTSGAEAFTSVTDTQSNTYTEVVQRNQTPGSAALDGCTVTILEADITTQLAIGNTIVANWSPNVTAKAWVVDEVTGASKVAASSGGNTGSGTTWTGNASASMNTDEIIIAACAAETATNPSNDSDTTNGSWTQTGANSGGTGGDGTKMAILRGYKIVNASGTQTFNSTGANTDWAVAFMVFRPSAVTLTAKAAGADSSKASISTPVHLNAKAATSDAAKATGVNRARPLAAKAATADSSKALILSRARPVTANAATADNAKATRVDRAASTVAKGAVAANANAALTVSGGIQRSFEGKVPMAARMTVASVPV